MIGGRPNGSSGGAVLGSRELGASPSSEGADLQRALVLLEKLGSSPSLRLLERLLAVSEQAPAVVASLADAVDGFVARARRGGVDWDERLRLLAQLAERLSEPRGLRLAASVLDQLQLARTSLVARGSEPAASVGPLGLWRALGEPDVRRSVGFALGVARRFGALLGAGAFSQGLGESALSSH